MDTAKSVESPTTRPPMVEPRRRRRPPRRPTLRFTPLAWAKLLFLRDRGPTEVGGFGLSAADDLCSIEVVIQIVVLISPIPALKSTSTSLTDWKNQSVAEPPVS